MQTSRHALSLLTVVSLITAFFAGEVRAAERGKAYWTVPVIYVTDRQTHKENYGPRRVLEKNTVARVDSGIIEMCVHQDPKEELADWQKTDHFERSHKAHAPKTTKFNCKSTSDLKHDFNIALRRALDQTGKREVFIFVHGFNNSFEDAAAGAAKLGYYTGCPVVLYSWPSAAKLLKYSLDECNNEWSQEHFNQFIEHLIALHKSDDINFTIAAHSMGNRLFVRSIPIITGTGLFKDIYMVNPDFDAETFIHYLARYLPRKGLNSGLRAQLLISRKDHALSFSEAIFGGYTRLGQGVDFTLSALTSPRLFNDVWSRVSGVQKQSQQQAQEPQPAQKKQGPEQTAIDSGSKSQTGEAGEDSLINETSSNSSRADTVSDSHGGDTQSDAQATHAKSIRHADSLLVASIDKAFKIYDVTALDRGFIGHKVPHEFIAWMHYRNEPPPGFKIEKTGKSTGLNRISSFFARGAKQNIAGGPLGDTYVVVKSTD